MFLVIRHSTYCVCRLSEEQHNILACSVTSTTSKEQGEWISSSRLNTDQLVESRRPRTRSESRHAEEGNSNNSEFVKQIQQEVEGEFRALLDSSDKEQSDQEYLFEFCEEDTMPYPYPKYNDEVDAKAHVCAFLMAW